jgi:iron(II)-dependent oxidoreductase
LWNEAPLELRHTAIEHRWMHAETMAYQLHNLPHERKRGPKSAAGAEIRPTLASQRMVTVSAGTATLGRKPGDGFGWDNEFQETCVQVPSFAISRFKVTNGEYLSFVQQGREAPHFWACHDGQWHYRGMFDFVPLPLDAPVYVTQEQAAAYARWRGADLPTEAQFHRAAFGTPQGEEREYPWGNDVSHPEDRGNFDFQHWDPLPVTSYPGGSSAFGVAQLVGNGWEWTKTPFAPLPGFEPAPNYPGYSADFFDGQHFVLKGASPRTAALLTRRSLRNWFRPDYPYLYATFRLVEN